MSDIRCIHKGRNKIGYFSPHLVNNDFWRKQTGWEPDFSSKAAIPESIAVKFPGGCEPMLTMPEQIPVSKPDELHATPVKRKGGRPKKNQQPA